MTVRLMNPSVVDALEATMREYGKCLKGIRVAGKRIVPSSGVVAAFSVRNLCGNITVYGFGSYPKTPYQYYRLERTERQVGNHVHFWKLERRFVYGK